jgi:hypothetical protein
MTVEQVGNAIGFKPTTVEEHACGDGYATRSGSAAFKPTSTEGTRL